MIYFRSDYSLGAHPDILDALAKTNMEHTDGYGLDHFCDDAAEIIRDLIGKPDANIHFMIGGTPTNTITISAALRPYEGVIAPASAHIYVHETGSIEATGHRIFAMASEDGKLTPDGVEAALLLHEDEHCVKPRMVYISQPTELGSVYTKAELLALHRCCKDHDLYLYVDGARLGTALTCATADITIKEMAELVDAFYIGGTKLGAMFGEALIILNDEINDNFRYMIKRHCGLLAKGRLLGVQFQALLAGGENSLYYRLARKENQLAARLADGIIERGYKMWLPPATNQLFVVLPTALVEELENSFSFYRWTKYDDQNTVIRLVTGWGSTDEDIDAFLAAL